MKYFKKLLSHGNLDKLQKTTTVKACGAKQNKKKTGISGKITATS
jgi:hypothetical protein